VKDPIQIRFSGAGGQGMITAGVILAEAAMLDGLNVVQTQTYGPEARLGSSRAEVIISRSNIAYPEVTTPDILVCLSAEAARKYIKQTRADTIVIFDSTHIGADITGDARVFRLPITDAAAKAGSKVVANTVALCAMNTIAHVVSSDALNRAISARVPPRFRELNEHAGRAGIDLAGAAAPLVMT
jgi:2-oxoglutarate ferredoxin oxidoreductase subunit gamma